MAPRTWAAEFAGFLELQLAYCQALSLVVLGRAAEAFWVIENLDPRLTGTFPAWMRQAWVFWKADLLMCASRPSEARQIAQQAFFEFGTELYSLGFAGPFARWLSHLGKTGWPGDTAKKRCNHYYRL